MSEHADGVEDHLLAGDAVRFDAAGRPHLLGGCCCTCGTRMFPRAPVCPGCMGEAVEEETMPDDGVLYSFSVLSVGPARFEKPVTLGYVDLPNGVRVFSHLAGDGLRIDGRVALDVAPVGTNPDRTPLRTFVFRPAGELS